MALSIKQQLLLDLMVRSDNIMRENDITYFLFGGSTLGALRHDGFIPWDDDIDIIIDVHNFKKLQKVFFDGPIDNIDLVFFNNDPQWYRPFAMLVSQTDTCYTMPVAYSSGKATGSRIDVMICDYVPSDKLEEYSHDLMLYEEVLSDTLITDGDISLIKDEYFELREKMSRIGKLMLEKELRDKLESYYSSDEDQLVVRFWTKELRHYEKDLIYPPLYHDFEGYMLPIPAKPEEQLRRQFGNDWYIIPSQDQQMSHAFVDNYYISGNNYHEDIQHFIDREKSERNARDRKRNLINNIEYTRSNIYFSRNVAFQREMMRADFYKRQEEYKALITNKDYNGILNALDSLERVGGVAKSVDIEHKQIPPFIMKAWLYSLVFSGRYYKASKISEWFEASTVTENSEVISLIDRVMHLANAFQDKRIDDMKEQLKLFSDEERRIIPECIFSEIEVRRTKEDNPISDEEIINKCNDYLKKFPDNYEIMKVKADALFRSKQTDEAMLLYEQVHNNTINGFDLYDIESRFNYKKRFEREVENPLDIMMRVNL